MKKVFTTFATAAIMTMAAGSVAAQNSADTQNQNPVTALAQTSSLKVRVSGIRETKGTILVALGDYTRPMEMAAERTAANSETVECTLTGNIDPAARIHVFHDLNGNFDLDRNERGIPVEGCFSGAVEKDADGVAIVKLVYYN
jgi:uncharacterized protein (DUF2141 family)